jgi:hypothetical protein
LSEIEDPALAGQLSGSVMDSDSLPSGGVMDPPAVGVGNRPAEIKRPSVPDIKRMPALERTSVKMESTLTGTLPVAQTGFRDSEVQLHLSAPRARSGGIYTGDNWAWQGPAVAPEPSTGSVTDIKGVRRSTRENKGTTGRLDAYETSGLAEGTTSGLTDEVSYFVTQGQGNHLLPASRQRPGHQPQTPRGEGGHSFGTGVASRQKTRDGQSQGQWDSPFHQAIRGAARGSSHPDSFRAHREDSPTTERPQAL